MKVDDFIKQRRESKLKNRKRVYAVLGVAIATLILLMVKCDSESGIDLEEDEKSTSKKSMEPIAVGKAKWRSKFQQEKQEIYRWASPLQERIDSQRPLMDSCMKNLKLNQLGWIFFYNPHTGNTRDHRFKKKGSDEFVLFEGTCLEDIVRLTFVVENSEQYTDEFFEVNLLINPVNIDHL